MLNKCSVIIKSDDNAQKIIEKFQASKYIGEFIAAGKKQILETIKLKYFACPYYIGQKEFIEIVESIVTPYFFLVFPETKINIDSAAIEKFIECADKYNSALTYSDYKTSGENNNLFEHPCIDYQSGAIRDNFDFGALILFNTQKTLKNLKNFKLPDNGNFETFFYDIRLKLSIDNSFFHIPDFLYIINKTKINAEDEQFSYVAKENFNKQKQFEKIASIHLKNIGALLPEITKKIEYSHSDFEYTASIVIPVRSRERTIADAVNSALNQKTNFKFNVIVIDNHSTDNTTEILAGIARQNSQIIHQIPEATDLKIGGCWNLAVNNKKAGMFCVQLDSDDIYTDENTLQKIIDAFNSSGGAAALVGSYSLVDFNLNSIPPGLIDHREWTNENGHNNGLRINGFGAPRAYYTPVIRSILFPNESYGEDYAVMIRITREYKLARIFESLYYCRRWENNSDSNISIQTLNKFNYYKDSLRSSEIKERIFLNDRLTNNEKII